VALSIAGSDSSGGAGIQADLKTFQAFGVFGTTAVTAVTAQNTRGVVGFAAIDPDLVAAQIRAVCDDMPPASTKTGMLATAAVVRTVAMAVRDLELSSLVVDPVMVATSGDRLLEAAAIDAIRDMLLPLATLVTPNIPEAEVLLGRSIAGMDDMRAAAVELVRAGAAAALVKGGHLPGDEIVDLLWDGVEATVWRHRRLSTSSTHGTGCTLSAAAVAGLARGRPLAGAVADAIDFTRRAIETAPRLGSGHGPVNHFIEPAIRRREPRCS